MVDEKNMDAFGSESSGENDGTSDSATRARNRTVMLTPEVTGQVRALLSKGSDSHEQENIPDRPSGIFSGQDPMTSILGGSHHQPLEPIIENPISHEPVVAPHTSTQSPIDPSMVNALRNQSVGVVSAELTPIVGFLVSFDTIDTGEVLELRTGRWIVSSQRTTDGNFLIIKDKTISPLHAIVRVTENGEIQVLDQLSEHGTVVISADGSEEELTGSMGDLEHGGRVKFGERSFQVCLLGRGE